MKKNTYSDNEQIPPEQWEEFCDNFTRVSQDRWIISLEVVGFESGDQNLAEMVPFSAIDYDTHEKGNTFILSYGSEAPLTTHTISEPAELWVAKDKFELVHAIEIVDLNNRKTIIQFE